MPQLLFHTMDGPWYETKDGDDDVREVFDRHYSRVKRSGPKKPKLFVGPGQKMVLRTHDCRAIFVWKWSKYPNKDGQHGINCTVFRNEGYGRSSDLILAAMKLAQERWPGERMFTYVCPKSIQSPNPGYCFKAAGWKFCGVTKKRKLHVLEYDNEST